MQEYLTLLFPLQVLSIFLRDMDSAEVLVCDFCKDNRTGGDWNSWNRLWRSSTSVWLSLVCTALSLLYRCYRILVVALLVLFLPCPWEEKRWDLFVWSTKKLIDCSVLCSSDQRWNVITLHRPGSNWQSFCGSFSAKLTTNESRLQVVKIIRKARHLTLITSFNNNNNLHFILRALRLIQQFYFWALLSSTFKISSFKIHCLLFVEKPCEVLLMKTNEGKGTWPQSMTFCSLTCTSSWLIDIIWM